MTEYLKSVFKKLDFFFYGNEVKSLTFFSDQDGDRLEDLVYLGNVGIFVDGVNPYFSNFWSDEVDIFNLYAKYNELK
ncbi:hypothetical protein [Xylocopilactobacillus apicola]|uniref:Uncharacterized protein n=1 Tax=Xylocopilactobacillus apicola TaxID=2932184 RepID=A0AAU9DHB7_9LACO|nr:hypothetical protein [Xylocopilactobacillus apicola]BDR57676.1 hypothetical protein XA3_01170 [Xylocopilactobacillus apicola]